jgi:hypothetical protein
VINYTHFLIDISRENKPAEHAGWENSILNSINIHQAGNLFFTSHGYMFDP